MESVEHKKERLEPLFFMLLWARTPLTIVAHILPGRRVVVRPTLGAIGSISARYHGADACLGTAAFHPHPDKRFAAMHPRYAAPGMGNQNGRAILQRLGVSLKSAECCCEHANGHRRKCLQFHHRSDSVVDFSAWRL